MTAAGDPSPSASPPRSLWLTTVSPEGHSPLAEELRVDVAVIGAGITGLTSAVLLSEAGARVAVLEARYIGAGATGYTTAKLTSLHGLTYAGLRRRHGEERARAYGEANEAGIAEVARLAARYAIDCNLERRPNFTYGVQGAGTVELEDEVEAARALGLPASYVDRLDLPFAVDGAVRFDAQAQFHPLRYVLGLARALLANGGRLFERTRAVEVAGDRPARVQTNAGHVATADHVVIATHSPILDRGLFFARLHPERSYVVAAQVDSPPDGMYLSTEQPAHSIRSHREDGRAFLLVGGESHPAGRADVPARYESLARYAREHFGIREVEERWATHDYTPADGMPYIGRLHPRTSNLWAATGFHKWGMAMGTAAAIMLSEEIGGRHHRWSEAFDPNRIRLRASGPSVVRWNAEAGLHFFGDRLKGRRSRRDPAPGEGAIVGSGLGQRAVYREPDGALHSLSARCTHLGCIVAWNAAERTWDCPCHGSRFDALGEVIEGPAVRPLDRRDVRAIGEDGGFKGGRAG